MWEFSTFNFNFPGFFRHREVWQDVWMYTWMYTLLFLPTRAYIYIYWCSIYNNWRHHVPNYGSILIWSGHVGHACDRYTWLYDGFMSSLNVVLNFWWQRIMHAIERPVVAVSRIRLLQHLATSNLFYSLYLCEHLDRRNKRIDVLGYFRICRQTVRPIICRKRQPLSVLDTNIFIDVNGRRPYRRCK